MVETSVSLYDSCLSRTLLPATESSKRFCDCCGLFSLAGLVAIPTDNRSPDGLRVMCELAYASRIWERIAIVYATSTIK
jgi:hypothetical protein